MESAGMKVLRARSARFQIAASSRFAIPRRPYCCSPRKLASPSASASKEATNASMRTFSTAGGSAPEVGTMFREDQSSSFSSSSSDGNNNSSNGNSVESLKERLLRESLRQVPEHGWTRDAIAAAAAAATVGSGGASVACAGLITVPDLLAHSMDRWNERLRRELRERAWRDGGEPNTATTAADRIAWALRRRLTYVQDLVRAGRWHEGMALGAHPDSAVRTQGQLATLIDVVLQETTGGGGAAAAAAKNGQEFSVVDRLSLGAVYVAVELHMLADRSTDFADTWAFLEHRVADWETLRASTGSLPPIPPVSNLLQYHSPTDLIFTASTVGSALASGALSVLLSSGPMTTTGTGFHPYTGQGQDFGSVHGTHPSDYEPPAASNSQSQREIK